MQAQIGFKVYHGSFHHCSQHFNSLTVFHFIFNYFQFQPKMTFLPNYQAKCSKTPTGSSLCLPSVYMIGVCKCGTTDFCKRLYGHQDIIPTKKEVHFWHRAWWQRERSKLYMYVVLLINYNMSQLFVSIIIHRIQLANK